MILAIVFVCVKNIFDSSVTNISLEPSTAPRHYRIKTIQRQKAWSVTWAKSIFLKFGRCVETSFDTKMAVVRSSFYALFCCCDIFWACCIAQSQNKLIRIVSLPLWWAVKLFNCFSIWVTRVSHTSESPLLPLEAKFF